MPDAGALRDQFRVVCYCLACIYAIVGIWSFARIIRLSFVSRLWTRQKLTHVFVFLLCAARTAFFGVVPSWGAALFYTTLVGGITDSWVLVLDELPSLLTISLFSMQLLMWYVIVH